MIKKFKQFINENIKLSNNKILDKNYLNELNMEITGLAINTKDNPVHIDDVYKELKKENPLFKNLKKSDLIKLLDAWNEGTQPNGFLEDENHYWLTWDKPFLSGTNPGDI